MEPHSQWVLLCLTESTTRTSTYSCHLHCPNHQSCADTWETLADLKAFKGWKRVENYVRTVYAPGVQIKTSPYTSREDLEAYEIDRERRREQLEGFKTVERIIASREADATEDAGYKQRELARRTSAAD